MLYLTGNRSGVNGIAFSPDGQTLYAAVRHHVRRWDVNANRQRTPLSTPWAHCASVVVSPDGRLLVASGWGVCVWDTTTDELIAEPSKSWNRATVFSPDGGILFAAHTLIQRWETATWSSLKEWAPPKNLSWASDLAVSPTGVFAAFHRRRAGTAADEGSAVLVRDAGTGDIRTRLESPNLDVTALAISPDGTRIVGANGAILRGWDVTEERELWKVKPANHFVTVLAFTVDGRHVLTAGNDETVRVLRVDDGTQATAYTWSVGKIAGLSVAPDGLRAAAGGSSGKVVVWDLDV